jgi:hypothetical protein
MYNNPGTDDIKHPSTQSQVARTWQGKVIELKHVTPQTVLPAQCTANI